MVLCHGFTSRTMLVEDICLSDCQKDVRLEFSMKLSSLDTCITIKYQTGHWSKHCRFFDLLILQDTLKSWSFEAGFSAEQPRH